MDIRKPLDDWEMYQLAEKAFSPMVFQQIAVGYLGMTKVCIWTLLSWTISRSQSIWAPRVVLLHVLPVTFLRSAVFPPWFAMPWNSTLSPKKNSYSCISCFWGVMPFFICKAVFHLWPPRDDVFLRSSQRSWIWDGWSTWTLEKWIWECIKAEVEHDWSMKRTGFGSAISNTPYDPDLRLVSPSIALEKCHQVWTVIRGSSCFN